MRGALTLALVVAGCADGKSVLSVSVSAAPPLAAVDHLRVTVTDLTRAPSRTSEPVFVPVAGSLPPTRGFALVLPSDLDGTVRLAVAAENPANGVLAAAEERVEVHPSREKAVALVLGTPGADWACLAISAGADLVGADLAGLDLAVPDASVPMDLSLPSRVPVRVARGANKMDILFVIDNSNTMSAKQALLKAALPSLMTALRSFGATTPVSYHIGVVTSDIGSGRYTVGGCTRNTDLGLAGDGAKLVPVGAAAPVGCAPPAGARFLNYNQVGGSDNSPDGGTDAGQSLEDTLGCMISVGSSGCGFEQTLEAAWQALSGGIPENAGFLRPDALLALFFLTDEDDCSALPESALFDINATQFGPLASFRCTKHGIVCGTPPAAPPNLTTDGGLPGCRGATAAEGSQLHPIERYQKLLSSPAAQGGLKINPAEMIVSAIVGDATPFDVILGNNTGAAGYYTGCSPFNGTTCQYLLQHSCVAGGTISADPAVRMIEAVSSAVNHQVTTICSNDYSSATSGLATMITQQFGPVCLPAALPDPTSPDCVVEDVTPNGGGFDRQPIVSCASSPAARPCWRLATNSACPSLSGQQLSLVIDRAVTPPASTIPNAACKF